MAAPHPPSWANKQDWRYIASTATRPEYIIYDKNIQKSPNDLRTYRLIQLENGLEALLVHDDTTDAAGASLDVGTGQLMDPVR
jgi:insulysin